jgi:uncharacterized protein (DUF2252 family)
VEVAEFSSEEAIATAHFLAEILGMAHGRQIPAGVRKEWMSELKRNRPKTIDAPSWLWTSVVELIAVHEKAYLDHCRTYALQLKEGR